MSYSRHSAQTAARHLARFISDDQDRIAAALCATPVVAALLTGDLDDLPDEFIHNLGPCLYGDPEPDAGRTIGEIADARGWTSRAVRLGLRRSALRHPDGRYGMTAAAVAALVPGSHCEELVPVAAGVLAEPGRPAAVVSAARLVLPDGEPRWVAAAPGHGLLAVDDDLEGVTACAVALLRDERPEDPVTRLRWIRSAVERVRPGVTRVRRPAITRAPPDIRVQAPPPSFSYDMPDGRVGHLSVAGEELVEGSWLPAWSSISYSAGLVPAEPVEATAARILAQVKPSSADTAGPMDAAVTPSGPTVPLHASATSAG